MLESQGRARPVQPGSEDAEILGIGDGLADRAADRTRGRQQVDAAGMLKSAKDGEVLGVGLSRKQHDEPDKSDNGGNQKKSATAFHHPPIINRMLDIRGLRPTAGPTMVLIFFLALVSPMGAHGQDPDPITLAREAATTTERLIAIDSLTALIEDAPSPDAYLYLGLTHARLQQFDRAREVFAEAAGRYPQDPRFFAETAGTYLAERNTDAAVDALERTLAVDPTDAYASDLLASIRLSEADVEGALGIWNAIDQPRVDQIFQNFSPGFLDRAVPRALTFSGGDIIEYEAWKTTQARLFGSELYSNVGLEIEPSPTADLYNAIVRTTARGTSARGILVGLVRGLPIETTYLDLNNIRDSGIGWRSQYRWDKDRRLLEGRLLVPLPVPGLPMLEIYDRWRYERWYVATPLGAGQGFGGAPDFEYKGNTIGASIHAIPHYRFEVGGGFEYRNRDATGGIAGLALDGRNSATFSINAAVRPVDGRYRSKIVATGFVARAGILGDFDFSGGTLRIGNRVALDPDGRTTLDFHVTGATARGEVPVDQYFVVGVGAASPYRLRGHMATDHDRYGRAPMGTDFVLGNLDLRHRLITLPLFDTFGVPFLEAHAVGFYDAAKVFDRQDVFDQPKWFHDVGAGLRFETPTTSFTVLYGRDTVGGQNALYGYVESRFW